VKDKYYIRTGSALAVLLAGLTATYLGSVLAAGASILLSYALYRQGVRRARLKGRTDNSKILHSITGNLIEFLGIGFAFFFAPIWPVVFASAAVGFRESFSQSLKNKSLGLNSELLGRTERVSLLGLSFLTAYFNEYLLVYGLVLVGSMALIETGRQVFLFLKK
jgi:hypothetical protein